MNDCFGHLDPTDNSPTGEFLREIFPDGTVPLIHPGLHVGTGREEEEVRLYKVDHDLLDKNQMDRILEHFKELGVKATREELDEMGYFLQVHHFSTVAFPGRLID